MQKVFFASLTKVKDADDDTLEVHGIASTESRDDSGEIITAAAMRAALPAYREYPAVREMHGLHAAGTAIEIDVDEAGITRIQALVVDAQAVKKVRTKVYRGFSIGGKVTKRDPKDPTIITGILLTEVSLVDRPANGEAAISLWKAALVEDTLAEDLAKIRRERDGLAKQLEHRDQALAKFADRAEAMVKSVNGIAKENRRLQRENTALVKRFAAIKPRIVNPEALSKTLVDLETTILPKLEADTASLRARFEYLDRGGRLDA